MLTGVSAASEPLWPDFSDPPRVGGGSKDAAVVVDIEGDVFVSDIPSSNAVNSLFFDWSACRYTSHDGYGSRGLGPTCTWAGGSFSDDAQTYGPESEAHTPVGASD